MEWYWTALIIGIIAPWIVMGRAIRIGFEEQGLVGGFGVWVGISIMTMPIAFLAMWVAQIILG